MRHHASRRGVRDHKTIHIRQIVNLLLCRPARIVRQMKNRTNLLVGLCIALVALMPARDSVAHRDRTKTECEKTRQKIAKIESKMRQGYRAAQGVKMEDELRRLRKLRAKQCR
jgi:hypothetical protein